jgi:hypothetical protein
MIVVCFCGGGGGGGGDDDDDGGMLCMINSLLGEQCLNRIPRIG